MPECHFLEFSNSFLNPSINNTFHRSSYRYLKSQTWSSEKLELQIGHPLFGYCFSSPRIPEDRVLRCPFSLGAGGEVKIEELWEHTNNLASCQNNQKLMVENNLRCRKLTHSSIPEIFEGPHVPSRDLAHGDRATKKTDQTLKR